MSVSLWFSEHLAPVSLLHQMRPGVKRRWNADCPFPAFFLKGSWTHWSETTCLSRYLPVYFWLPGCLPTSPCRWIKVLNHQTLMLTRFTGPSAGHVMSTYHDALTMVVEGQLCVPRKDMGSTITNMQNVKQLPKLQPATHPRKKTKT